MSEITVAEPTSESPLTIIIKDASIKDGIISFTIQMKTILPQYITKDSTVSRTHLDFEVLHRNISTNPKYAGLIIPPCPPKPDFSIDRDSIAAYTDDDNPESDEYKKMKQELEREYLALFKKTVGLHDSFLSRVSHVPLLRIDPCFIDFLSLTDSLNSKSSATAMFKDMFRGLKKTLDENIINTFSSIHEPDTFFEEESHYLNTYIMGIKNCYYQGETMTICHKRLANTMIKLSLYIGNLGVNENSRLARIFEPLAAYMDRCRKCESRISSDEDLKLVDTLKYHCWNAESCKDMLLRRIQSLVVSENNLKALNKAKQTGQNVSIADDNYQQSLRRFENISECAKSEIERENKDRIADLKKNLTSYCELMILHHNFMLKETQQIIDRIEAEDCS